LWATKPVNARRIRETQEANKILKEENRLSVEREEDLIGKAERDVQVGQLPEGVREELQKQIDELRNGSVDNSSLYSIPKQETSGQLLFTPVMDEIVRSLGSNERKRIEVRNHLTHRTYKFEGEIYNESSDVRAFVQFEDATNRLIGLDMLDSTGSISNPLDQTYKLTVKGYERYDTLLKQDTR
jgi:hypothetical protein